MGLKVRLTTVTVLASGACTFTGWWYRPIPDDGTDARGPQRTQYMSRYSLADAADRPHPLLFQASSQFVIMVTAAVARTFLFLLGDCHIKKDEHHEAFLKAVTDREAGVPLLTVSNHRSLVDDPTIMSGVLPLWLAMQPKYNRYSVCSQEYAFNEKLPSLFHAYVGLGRVLPIKRGAGINQKLLLDYARLVAAGEWCHVFPEGGIWQTDTIGGRNEGRRRIGKLKWGVGKLIAHAPKAPKVVPFFFTGTETIYPQHPDTKAVSNLVPIPGHRVHIRFGPEVQFQDLISEHEKKYGPLSHYHPSIEDETQAGISAETEGGFHSHWDSKPENLMLYSKITMRIEQALEKLNGESNAELALIK